MLKYIHLKNMVLIDEEEIIFGPGLNILTGETGAGKSIVIGSIGLAFGAGSFREAVKEGASFAMVELTFETDSECVAGKLEELALPSIDGLIVISRVFRGGRTVSRVNGQVVTIGLVRDLASLLIDIHGQHEHQSLLYPKNHLALVDSFANNVYGGLEGTARNAEVISPFSSLAPGLTEMKKECAESYRAFEEASRELEKALSGAKDRLRQIDFLTYEINEIDDAALRVGEDSELQTLFKKLSGAEKIRDVLTQASDLTSPDEGALMSVSKACGLIASVNGLDEELIELSDQLLQIEDLLGDFTRSISMYLENFTYDEQDLIRTGDRLDLINRLKERYGRTIPDILEYRTKQAEKLARLTDFDAYAASLEEKKKRALRKLTHVCDAITKIRKASASQLEKLITDSLSELNFPDVKFVISFKELSHPTAQGNDEVNFLISTNPGMKVRPLQDVASGGELSRIMLGIKTVMARKDDIGSLIFDEIDAGISGRTAQKVSEKMVKLSKTRQVIAITHLPQIASMADNHYLIEKKVVNGRTSTKVRKLSGQGEIEELARILGGTEITDKVRANAEEMKRLADRYKADISA